MTASTIAAELAAARAEGRALPGFPGDVPATLAEAYAIQDEVIAALGLVPTGWKVGMIAPAAAAVLGKDRLVGPAANLLPASTLGPTDVPVIDGGFAAIEAEFVLLMGEDLPLRSAPYSDDDLLVAVAAMHIGVEVAGSSIAGIIDLGPTAVVADLGNNAALVIGGAVADWQARALKDFETSVAIDLQPPKAGSLAEVPGGPLAALRFLVENLASRGRHLRRGDFVSTGATCGVHPISPGSSTVVGFGLEGALALNVSG